MFLQLTHVKHEFSKIGNKVFIPPGVKNLFPKIEPLAKHIALRQTVRKSLLKIRRRKIRSKKNWVQKRVTANRTASVETHTRSLFQLHSNGVNQTRPAIAPFRLRRDHMCWLVSCHGMSHLAHPNASVKLKSSLLGASPMLLCVGTLLNQVFNWRTDSLWQKPLMMTFAISVAP